MEDFDVPVVGSSVELNLSTVKVWKPPAPGPLHDIPEIKIPESIANPARAFLDWLAGKDKPDDSLIGLGPGLTPAGDDFVGGTMIALRAFGRIALADRIAEWALPLAKERTNRISRAHLECAAEGEGHEYLHDLLATPGKENLKKLARVGHTSGLDAAAGALLALALFISGCGSIPNPSKMEHLDDIPAEMVPRLDAMRELPADKPAAFETIGTVEGVSCKRAYKGASASWEDATRRTKFRALQLGADAIANLSCGRPEGASLTAVCLESIRCTANAVRARQ
ncbi:MAG: DUF2877 domain-containing protein [Burkholderiales bacterium]